MRFVQVCAGAVFVTTLLALAACGGPTKTGIEARKAANDRFNRVSAGVATQQAEQSLSVGQFKEALDQIDHVVEAFPDDPTARLLRGRIVLEMGRLELAMKEFQNAAELDPSCDECLYYQGVVSQRWGRDIDALAAYAGALRIDPTSSHYLLAQAETLLALGRVEDAKALIEDSSCHFEFSSSLAHLRSEVAAAEGDAVESLQQMELAVTLAPDPSIYHEDLALVSFRAQNWDRCLNALDTLPAKLAQRDDLVRLRARALSMTDRGIEARDLLKGAENQLLNGLEPGKQATTTVEHDLALGYIAWMIGDVECADICARRLMGRNPRLCDGYLLKGMVCEARGDLANAVQLFRKASDLDPARTLPQELLIRAEAALTALGGVSLAHAGR